LLTAAHPEAPVHWAVLLQTPIYSSRVVTKLLWLMLRHTHRCLQLRALHRPETKRIGQQLDIAVHPALQRVMDG
jgi:hypothetical protein